MTMLSESSLARCLVREEGWRIGISRVREMKKMMPWLGVCVVGCVGIGLCV